jgi:type II secretion system protein N
MNPLLRERLLRYVGYPAFFAFALGLMLFLTFPYGLLKERVVAMAKQANIPLSIDSMGPAFFGVRAKGVHLLLSKAEKAEGQDAAAAPLTADEVILRPGIFPPGIRYSAKLFGGSVEGRIGTGKRPHLELHAKGLDLERSNSKAALGLDLAGKLGATVDLDVDRENNAKTVGQILLSGNGITINGGTVAQYDLPRVEVGLLDAELKLDAGKASVKSFKAEGADVDATVEGDINLAQKLLFSNLRLKLKFKPSEDFLKRNSFIQTGLGFAMGKDSRGYHTINVERMLGNPRFQPVK